MQQIECKESSNIGWARYDESTRVLEVDFKNAAGVKVSAYSYSGVPPELWAQFNAATSKGRFFATYIRNAVKRDGSSAFQSRKIWP